MKLGVSRMNSTRLVTLSLVGCLIIGAPGVARPDDLAAGRRLYVEHCAACHGINGDGHGPLEHELARPATDLRMLSKKYGNPLPDDQIARFMDGRADVQAHGPRDMPVWGWEMWRYPAGKGDRRAVSEPVAQIVRYLQSIQVGSSPALLKQNSSP
jgi:mono/diheme cytochrome c family protein